MNPKIVFYVREIDEALAQIDSLRHQRKYRRLSTIFKVIFARNKDQVSNEWVLYANQVNYCMTKLIDKVKAMQIELEKLIQVDEGR